MAGADRLSPCPASLRGSAWAVSRMPRWPIPTGSIPTARPTTTAFSDGRLTFHQPGPLRLPRKRHRPCALVPGAQGPGAGAGGAAPMERRRGRPRGLGEAAEPLRNQRLAHDHGVPRRAHAGGTGARRLPRFQQHRPHHPRRAPIRHRCPRLPGLAGGSRATSGSASWAPAWAPAWRSSRRPTTRACRWASSTTFPCTSPTWSGPGLSTQHVRQGFGDEVSQDDLRRYWAVISPASLPGTHAGPRHAQPADLGAARHQFPAGVFAAGAATLPRARICRTKFSPCPAATTPPDSFLSS